MWASPLENNILYQMQKVVGARIYTHTYIARHLIEAEKGFLINDTRVYKSSLPASASHPH